MTARIMPRIVPRIVATGTAIPPHCFTQEEVLRMVGYTQPAARKIFRNSEVDTRYFFIEPGNNVPRESLDELQARYRQGALLLARQAAECCLTRAGLQPEAVDCILICSCTGYLCPDLATLLVKEMGLSRRVQRGALLGHGCAGALPGLQRAYDHACAYPDHRVLLVAVEICSATYYVDETLETVVANAICADGAAACLLSCQAETGPRIVSFASVLETEHQDKVGFGYRQGRLRVILAAEIRDLAPAIVDRVLDDLLVPLGVSRDQIRYWLMHPGGRKVIDRVQASLGLSDGDVALSRRVLRNYGNMSSSTVLFVLHEVINQRNARAGDRGVLLALGPGFAAESALLEW
jgi:3,5-dihydroxyphenylacetyl-CoA synthase